MITTEKKSLFSAFGSPPLLGWAILPLRFFLAFSFLSAGWDKLNDPAFLDPAARDYIGNQIARFAPGTPLEGFLQNFAIPNATLFGVMTMGGELCIGLAVLLGLLTRFSAAMGLLLNLTFFLSATWDIHPFYFGPDLPYAVCWLTLLLAGPGPLALDIPLRRWLSGIQPSVVPGAPAPASSELMTRRAFVGIGASVLAGAVFIVTGVGWGLMHPRRAEALVAQGGAGPTATVEPIREPTTTPLPTQEAFVAEPTSSPAVEDNPTTAPTDTPAPEPTAAPTSEATRRQLVAAAGALPQGQVLEFSLPTGQPAVLVHNDAGYSAYVAICTHQGCVVRPAGSGLLKCPCHGSMFDPKASGEPLNGPARRPLSTVPLLVDEAGNVYLAG